MVPTAIEAPSGVQKLEQTPLDLRSNENPTIDDSALSRALKRKFTELEEITQRLRARLFDVTGDMSMDPDDEFENDLNTIPNEDDDFEESNIASEMSLDWLEHCQNQASSSEQSSLATQMQDIFRFLSPDKDIGQSPFGNELRDNDIEATDDNLSNDRRQIASTDTNNIENTVQNIADSLQKSLLQD